MGFVSFEGVSPAVAKGKRHRLSLLLFSGSLTKLFTLAMVSFDILSRGSSAYSPVRDLSAGTGLHGVECKDWSAGSGVQGLQCRDLSAGTGVHGVECRDWSAKTGVQGLQCMDCSEGNQKGPLKNLQQLKHVGARTADPSMREEATGVERLQNLDVWKRKGEAIMFLQIPLHPWQS